MRFIICWPMTEPGFYKGIWDLFKHFSLFSINLLHSGCKINLSKSEVIHIGSLKGTNFCPFEEGGLRWRTNSFKTLRINFSVNINSLYELNFIPSFIKLSKPLTVGGIEIFLFWVKSLLLNPCCCPSFSTFFLCFVLIF